MGDGQKEYRENLRRILLDTQFYLILEGIRDSLFEVSDNLSPSSIKRHIIAYLKKELAKDGLDERDIKNEMHFL